MALILLEAFDAPDDPVPVETGPSEDWLDGHAAGVAEATAGLATEAARRSADLTQALADLGFTLAEARRTVLDSLAPLFEAMIGTLLPGLVEGSLVAHAVDRLMEAAADRTDPPVALVVHPTALASMAEALAGLPGMAVDLRGDDTLGPLEIVIRRRGTDLALDLDRLREELTQLLALLATPSSTEKERRHG